MREMNRREFLGSFILTAIAATAETRGVEPMGLERAKEFANQAKRELRPDYLEGEKFHKIPTCCIDGRRPKGEDPHNSPPCAIPGGDEGLMASTLAALNELNVKSPEAKQLALEALVNFRGGPNRVQFHTDQHAEAHKHGDPQEIVKGCGHFRLSSEHPENYGLEKTDIDLITANLNELANKGAVREVLSGEHEEGAVMIIESENLALAHQTNAGQAFIYNHALHTKLLKEFAIELSPKLSLRSEDLTKAFLDLANKQLMETTRQLAKGRNIYKVSLGSQKELLVEEMGKV